MRNFTHRWPQAPLPKIGKIFPVSKKRKGSLPPLPPLVTRLNQISDKAKKKTKNHNLDMERLLDLRTWCSNNLIIGYFNINNLRNEITQWMEVYRKTAINLLCRDEIKLDASFTAWKLPVFGIILVRIFPHLDWIRRNTSYLSVFSPNVGKCKPE